MPCAKPHFLPPEDQLKPSIFPDLNLKYSLGAVELKTKQDDRVKFNVLYAGDWDTCTAPIIVFFHGAGHTVWTFAHLSTFLGTKFRIAAFDCRGHGMTEVLEGDECDWSIGTLVADGIAIVKSLCAGEPVILCGHSMGGAVCVRVAKALEAEEYPLLALCTLDVCGESGLACGPACRAWLDRLPRSFSSIDEAISFAAGRLVGSRRLASISIPSQLVYDETKKEWHWRAEIFECERYWDGWFRDLDADILSIKTMKILVFAGIRAVAKALLIANMQGRIQLEVLGKQGHIIQEDQAMEIFFILERFIRRQQSIPPKGMSSTESQENL